MTWHFDQAPNVTCIASRSVFEGKAVLVVTHYEDDHSWAFLDGERRDPADALVVAMSEVLTAHLELIDIAELPPGWTASRVAKGEPWSKQSGDL